MKKRSKKLRIGRKMPPAYHTLPGEDFDINKSEAVAWLLKQPEIKSFIWDQFKQSNDIEYDPETGLWIGMDFDGEDWIER